LGFIEFTETEHGKKIGEGPRNEKEEALAHERWKVILSSVFRISKTHTTDSGIEKQQNLNCVKLGTKKSDYLKDM